ncbi:MAG: hypothetical protein M3Z54_02635 [Gemmatimonadota bacterium]|nr:hypothetical protein [Gemmatimonadota bacterium]
MTRFADARAKNVYRTGVGAGVPARIARRAHWVLHLLLAAHGLQDVGVIGRIERWASRPGRYGINIDGKWFVTFAWDPPFGANAVRLERL